MVVAIRGSVTSADWITDMLGVPERLDDWIPESFKEARGPLSTFATTKGWASSCLSLAKCIARRRGGKCTCLCLLEHLDDCLTTSAWLFCGRDRGERALR